MANHYGAGIIFLDTPSATPFMTDRILIHRMKWVSATATAGDRAVVQDSLGHSIWEGVAPGTQYDTGTFTLDLRVQGILVPRLDSGAIYLYVL